MKQLLSAIEEKKLVISKNAEQWHSAVKKCLGRFVGGNATVSSLFDRMDFTTYPPSGRKGGVDYYLVLRTVQNAWWQMSVATPRGRFLPESAPTIW